MSSGAGGDIGDGAGKGCNDETGSVESKDCVPNWPIVSGAAVC